MFKGEDTIAAIATGLGEGGIGIVRISGAQALAVAERCFRARRGKFLSTRPSHSVTYGEVVDHSGQVVDEALALLMKGPRSFTGEDVVEIHCHGGQVALRRVLDMVLGAGARLAEPGEFSRRSFLNGRMDLAQAEAVIEIIRAKTDKAMEAAVHQLRGGMSGSVRAIRDRLVEAAAHLEADIDFPELELEVQTQEQVRAACTWCIERVEELLRGAKQGKLLREGFRVVLAGRPNVGKSSLLNRLVRENRAIVTEIPGTTRDVIEEWVNIQGLPVMLADTAGIRETEDVVERLGVDRSRAMLERADLVLLLVDAVEGVTQADRDLLTLMPPGKQVISVVNKVDLVSEAVVTAIASNLEGMQVLALSAQEGVGIQALEETILAAGGLSYKEEGFLANARQEEALRRSLQYLQGALAGIYAAVGSDLVSIDVRSAWETLGEITGDSVGEDLLDQIFSRFCIGK